MKTKNILTAVAAFCLLLCGYTGTQAQCTYDNTIFLTWDASTQLVNVSDQVSSLCTYGGEYNRVTNMVAGNTYRISTCTNTAFDTQITIFTAGGGSVVAYDDDNCGLQTEIFFTPGTSGDYDIQINEFNCITNTTCMDMVVELVAVGSGVGCSAVGSQWPTSTLTPTGSWQTASTIVYGGDYSLYNVTAGSVYEWSYCVADGGDCSFDSELTLYNNANLSNGLAYADDVCGDDAKLTWTATFTGVARVITHEFSCATNSIGSTLRYRSASGGAPVNDLCAAAISLSTSPTCNPVNGTTQGATQSLPGVLCDGFTSSAALDVWYSFVADNTTATVTVVGSSDIDAVVEVLTGACGSQTNFDCADATLSGGTETLSLSGLTIGNTYYVRVYDWGTTLSTTFTFNICVVSTPAGVANDNCSGATTLTVGTGECNPVAGSVAGATASSNPSCGTGTPDDDVWYKFVATGPVTIVDVLGSSSFDAVVEVFYGTDCNSLTSLGCIDGSLDGEIESVEITGLITGETIWIRVYDYYSGAPPTTDFTICVFNPCAVTVPIGAIAETEVCGEDLNGGCNMLTPAYQDITCGQTVQGTMWADTSLRDTDWYRFTVASNTTVTWTAAAEMPFGIALVDITDCNTPVVLTNGGSLTFGSACTSINVSMALTPGTYVAFIAPDDFNYYVCSAGLYNEYWATLTMSTTTPVITPSGATTFCTGGSVTLNSSAATSYLWTPGGATTQSITANATGSYSVAVTDANGCGPVTSSPVSVTVNQNPVPVVSAGGSTTFCEGGSVTLTSTTADSYVWSPNGETTQAITATASGTYSVNATVSGCSGSSTTTTVTVNQNPSASFTFVQNDPTIDFTGSASGGNPGYNYDWDFGDGNTGSGATTSHTYVTPSTYNVELCVTDANNCVNCTTQTVTILTIGIETADVEELNIFPNPATDLLNITFSSSTSSNIEVKLMNSNGQLLFSEMLSQFTGNYTKQLDISAFAAGNYMLQVVTEKGITNRKIMIK